MNKTKLPVMQYEMAHERSYVYEIDDSDSDYNVLNEKRQQVLWDEKEMMNLVYAVDKEGKNFSKIEKTYRKYFRNRSSDGLRAKYSSLANFDCELFEKLENQVK